MDMKLEVVVVPVSDVDRAKAFYTALGWREDADFATGPDFRVVQLTPPGSDCSVIFGTGLTSATPGSADGLQLVGRRHRGGARPSWSWRRAGQRGLPRRRRGLPPRRDDRPGRRARLRTAELRLVRLVHRPGRQQLVRAGGHHPPAGPGRRPRRRRTSPPPTWPRRCAARPPRTAGTRPRPGRPTRTGRTGTRSTWSTSAARGRAADERLRLRRDHRRRRLAGRALRRRAGRWWAAGGGRRAGAGRWRVLLLGVHPVQDAAAPRRGGAPGTRGGGHRGGRRRGRAGLAGLHGLGLLRCRAGGVAGEQGHRPAPRQRAGWPGPGSSRSTASSTPPANVVLATGSDPVVPPVPGLRELDGVWTNREATGMKAVPRRLLILGGGPVGTEMAQAVRRLGRRGDAGRGVRPRARPRAGAAGRGARGGAAPRRRRAAARRARVRGAARGRRLRAWSSTTAVSCAATGCWSPPAAARAWTGSAWRRSAPRSTSTASRSTRTCGPAIACGPSATSPGCGC